MIQVKTNIGTFKIVDGKFVEGEKDLEALFRIHTKEHPNVWEGPVDYAIAARMCKGLSWTILNEKYSDSDPNVVY
ncbi:hypothetical protein ACFL0S_10920 [Thermodesulfobacteriota bacterium]